MSGSVYDVLMKRLEELRESRATACSDGAAKDYAAYRELCGVIQGLDLALNEVKGLSRANMEDGDDE